jgi:thiol-disulfide isomerase/thioredoxin
MKNLFFLFALSASLFLTGCAGEDAAFTLNVTVSDAADLQLFFDKVGFSNENNIIQKQDFNSSGLATVGLEEHPGEGIYRIRIGAKKGFLVLDGKEKKIEVNGKLADFDASTQKVTGSKASMDYLAAEQQFKSKQLNADNFPAFIESNDGMVVSLLAYNMFSRKVNSKVVSLLEKAGAKLKADYPTSKYTTDFAGFTGQRVSQLEQLTAGQVIPIENRKSAQEIDLPSPNGNSYSLSDLKGKVVLVDFWASWCRPCRAANPHVVSLYDKHHKDGFEIFSVSLDGDNKRWADAIKKDDLKWRNHVSDLKKWQSAPAKAWGVSSIPKTFLIDRDGRIAAINPNWRNGQLDAALEELLKG